MKKCKSWFARKFKGKLRPANLSVTEVKYAVCECGAKIEIVQDLDRMRRAIDAHATKHGKAKIGREESEAERRRIEYQLAKKTIMSIIDMDADETIVATSVV